MIYIYIYLLLGLLVYGSFYRNKEQRDHLAVSGAENIKGLFMCIFLWFPFIAYLIIEKKRKKIQ